MSITTEITRLQNAKAALKGSIEAKGVTVASDATLDQYPALVDEIPQGGDGAAEKDVNFYDYDGTVLYSYTKQEFLALAAMPDNPDRTSDGLTAQGWNWSFNGARDYVSDNGFLEIGQIYKTTDGDTKIFVNIPEDDKQMSVRVDSMTTPFSFGINWGDGSSIETYTKTSADAVSHSYANSGSYIISIHQIDYNITFRGSNSYSSANDYNICGTFADNRTNNKKIYKIFLGDNVQVKGDLVFAECYNLEAIMIPSTYDNTSEVFVCLNSGIKCIVLPKCLTVSLCSNSFNVEKLSLSEYDNNTMYSMGAATMQSLKLLKRLTIPKNISASGYNAFNGYNNLRVVVFTCGNIGSNILNSSTVEHAVIGKDVTSISGSTFKYCSRLRSVDIKSTVLTSLGDSVFDGCYSLSKDVKLPSTITSIGNYVFRDCRYLEAVYLYSINPPSLGSSVFQGAANLKYIYVPAASVEDYKAASGWSTYADKIVAIPE